MSTEERPEIKLIALDMDGTLLNDNHEISPGNREAIIEARELNVPVMIATGRTRATCGSYAQSLGLQTFLVTANGGEIYNKDGDLIHATHLHEDAVNHVYELRERYGAHVWAASSNGLFRGDLPEDRHNYQWLKFGFDTTDDGVRKEIVAELTERGLTEITNSSPTNIEVNAIGINKASAIKLVCDELGIDMQHVMAVGDSLNDIAMIQEAGLGVAMGNAQDLVKRKADWITATNVNDGVAAAIHRWVVLPKMEANKENHNGNDF
ncbi:Cof-type HAD-IIB family hydrolase [Shouchella sp. JSM 1781072]|uniref:Cof-type HAD-IIB family hydrolase n=1 Tax=Bacillaceae TaxID=186817 RepID=UPI000C07B2C8|nr:MULTISPECIES: Cof-type HAD-IIB family hydrolase [Bacillaceae]UTR06354.1 Cof-type HAD-IIB family hydrolase [Alkalihalobacillus sp. LMS6]